MTDETSGVNTVEPTEAPQKQTGLSDFNSLTTVEKKKLSSDDGRKSITDELISSIVLEEKTKRIGLLKTGMQKLEALNLEKRKVKPVITYMLTEGEETPKLLKTFKDEDFKKIQELDQKIKKQTDALNMALEKADYSKLINNDNG